MKQLALTLLLSLSITLINAQQSDTLEIQRNKNGNVTYAPDGVRVFDER
jgi:hypothetical protein